MGPTKLPENRGESREATGAGSSQEAACSQTSDDLDSLPEGKPTKLPENGGESPEAAGAEAADFQSSDDLDALPEVKQRCTVAPGKPTKLPEIGGESPEGTGAASALEAAGSRHRDDPDTPPEVPCGYKTPSPERLAVDQISAASIRSPKGIAALPTGMELRGLCGGSRLPHGRRSLATANELRALLLGTHTIEPLLSERMSYGATRHVAQLCHTTPNRSMLPVRSLSCQANSTRVANLYGTCNGLLLPARSGTLPIAQELHKALQSPRLVQGHQYECRISMLR